MSVNRRVFSVSAALLGATGALTSALPAWAQAGGQLREGTDYVRLPKPVSTNVPAGKVEVIEFFWYACPHCNSFEPMFENWRKVQPDTVVVRRVPVAFQQNNNFVPLQKLYYTLETMQRLEDLHLAAFAAIHRERRRLNSDEAIFDWAQSQDVDIEEFKKVYNSFSVSNAARRASQLQDEYGVEGVPSLGVAGKYYTDGTMARNLANALQVVERLVALELAGG